MASSNVIVIDTAFKRTPIKVTPSRYMRDVLEEACRTRKLDPEGYILKNNEKIVDLSQPFRLSGMPAGAKLQLLKGSRTATVVEIALQLPQGEGGRKLVDKFPSTTSLWMILRKFEDAVAGQPLRKLNITQRAVPSSTEAGAGRLEYEQPCLNIMGRNLESFLDLQKTLSQLGISKNAMMRLTFKSTKQPLEEAMEEIGKYFSSVNTTSEAGNDAANATPSISPQISNSENNLNFADSATEQQTSLDSSLTSGATIVDSSILATNDAKYAQSGSIHSSSRSPLDTGAPPPSSTIHGMAVFRPPSSRTPAAALHEEDPSSFVPGIEHAKAHQAALNRASRNTRLKSDTELAAEESQRNAVLAAIQTVRLRVRYPDQSMVETAISSGDTPADLYTKIGATLATAHEPFELRYVGAKGPHTTLPSTTSKRLVKDFGFRGSILLTLVWSPEASLAAKQGPSLKEEYRAHAQDLRVVLQNQSEQGDEDQNTAISRRDPTEKTETLKSRSGDMEGKMKKFLGLGRKH